jgi:hypothetical protein
MTEQRIAGWTAPNGDVTIQVWNVGTVFQVREWHYLGTGQTVEPYETEAEARAVARAKAQIIRWNQTGR